MPSPAPNQPLPVPIAVAVGVEPRFRPMRRDQLDAVAVQIEDDRARRMVAVAAAGAAADQIFDIASSLLFLLYFLGACASPCLRVKLREIWFFR